MYTKRIQIDNYGPIDHLDITLPFKDDAPKPVILVGENGSGKSILLSHIVNGLVSAQSLIYPETPEVEVGKVYKLRNNSYIKSGREFYFSRVDFEDNLFIEEIRSLRSNEKASSVPSGLTGIDVKKAWEKMKLDKNDHFDTSFSYNNEDKIEGIFSRNCVIYFPPNRFEEPAWLNEENLKAKANYMNLKRFVGHTNRKVIQHSPLHDNQNWLFDVIFDRAVFETQTTNISFPIEGRDQPISVPISLAPSGNATSSYNIALQIVQSIMNRSQNIRFGIGRRLERVVSIMENEQQLVPNIFQLSSGETSLLNLFLSILRDFDLCGASFTKPEEIRGIVIVDEIDLHLHAVHQYTILPELVKMFPRLQFVVTTHSPLFVLGMGKTFGQDGFALYSLPQGQQISPEEFSEFGSAYQSFSETKRFLDDIQRVVKDAQKPIIFMDGKTDVKFLEKAAELLDKQAILEKIKLWDGEGHGNLDKIWGKFDSKLSEIIPQKVILLYDCDNQIAPKDNGNVFKRSIPEQESHPLKKGVENLFKKATLERAIEFKPAFIDIIGEHLQTERGKKITIPEKWMVNPDEKTNLCHWLCENGTAKDFKCFQVIFDLLEEILRDDEGVTAPVPIKQSSQPSEPIQQP